MVISHYFEVIVGIKSVEVDQQGFNFSRGKQKTPSRINASEITGVNVFNKGPRPIVLF